MEDDQQGGLRHRRRFHAHRESLLAKLDVDRYAGLGALRAFLVPAEA